METPVREQYSFGGGLHSQFALGEEITHKDGYYYPPHWHTNIEIIYIGRGKANLFLSSKWFELNEGDLLFINPDQVHAVQVEQGIETNYLILGCITDIVYSSGNSVYEYKYILPFISDVGPEHCCFRKKELEASNIALIIEEIRDEVRKERYGFEISVRANVMKLLLWILRKWEENLNINNFYRLSDATLGDLHNLFNYISINYQEDISPKKAAVMCNFSYSYFCKVFRKVTGATFSQYLCNLRLREAEKLLASTSLDITEIANKVGFCDSSYFIKMYKRLRGITPKAFRKLEVTNLN